MVMEESVQTAFMQRIIKQGLVLECATVCEPAWMKAAKEANEDLYQYGYAVIIDAIEDGNEQKALELVKKINDMLEADPGPIATDDGEQSFLKMLEIKEQISKLDKKKRDLEKILDGFDSKVKDPVLKITKTVHTDGLKEIVDQMFGPRWSLKSPTGKYKLVRDYTFRSGYMPNPVLDGFYFKYKVEE